MNKKVNLKELKDALNKISDDDLFRFEADNKLSGDFEDSDSKVDIVFYAGEEDHGKIIPKYDENMKVVQNFVKGVVESAKQSFAADQDEDYAEYLSEQVRVD